MSTSSGGGGGGGGGGSGSGSGGGIPTIVTTSIESPTSEENAITREFESFRINNASQVARRRFSVFNKAFDPESGSSSESSSSSEFKIKSDITEEADSNLNNSNNQRPHHHHHHSHQNYHNQNTNNMSGGYGYEENIETKANSILEERHKATASAAVSLSDELRRKISGTLASIVLFKQMFDTHDETEESQLLDSMFERPCRRGEVIIAQGDEGNYFYVIIRGTFEIYVKAGPAFASSSAAADSSSASSSSQYGRRVAQLKDKGYFGELALLYNQPRSATIVCTEDDSVLYCLNRKNFQEVMIRNSFKRRQTYKDLLKTVPLLRDSLSELEISKVADALSERVFKSGEMIFRQNDVANGIYFIETGYVNIFQEIDNGNGNGDGGGGGGGSRVLLRRLKPGEYFGEVALINKSPRSASAYAEEAAISKETCRVAFLDLDAFERLLGPCVELFKSKMVDYKNFNK